MEKLKIAFQITGIKNSQSKKLCDLFFNYCIQEAQQYLTSNSNQLQFPCYMTLSYDDFKSILLENHQKQFQKSKFFKNFTIAEKILDEQHSLIILLGGPSGTGKSSIASLLASRFQISNLLSTDSVRHIMRNFLNQKDNPVLFASTYEADTQLQKVPEYETLNPKKRVIKAFRMQSLLVQDKLEQIIQKVQEKGESIVIEGVHLTPDFMLRIWKKFPICLPFMIYISNEEKHKERFAVRSKYLTVDAKYNKYVSNLQNIRTIQNYLIKQSDQRVIPKLDNTNIDKTMNLIYKTMMRFMRKVYINKTITKDEISVSNNTLFLYEEYNIASKNLLSTVAVKDFIKSKADKEEVYKRFFEDCAVQKESVIHESDKIEQLQSQQISYKGVNGTYSIDKSSNDFDQMTLKSFQQLNLEQFESEDKLEERIYQYSIMQEKILEKIQQDNELDQLQDETPINISSKAQSQITESSNNKTKTNKTLDEETKAETKKMSKIQVSQITEFLQKDKKISLSKGISAKSIQIIKKWLKEYNNTQKQIISNDYLKLIETTERYIIFKCNDNGQFLQKNAQKSQNLVNSMLKPNELQIRNRQKKKLKLQFHEEKEPIEEDRVSDYSDQKSSFSQGKILDQKFKLKLVTKGSGSPRSQEALHEDKNSEHSQQGILEEDENEIYYNEEQIDNLDCMQLEEAQCSVNETDKMHDDEDNISDTSWEDIGRKQQQFQKRFKSLKSQENNLVSSQEE